MLINSIRIDVISGATCFDSVPAIILEVDSGKSDTDNVQFDPKYLKAKKVMPHTFVSDMLDGKVKGPIELKEAYYDDFFSALSKAIRGKNYHINHVMLLDKNKYGCPSFWKVVYSLNYTTTCRIQLVFDYMPKLPNKLQTVINSSSPKVWVTTQPNLYDEAGLDPRFITKSNEVSIGIGSEEDYELAMLYLVKNTSLVCPVFVRPLNEASKFLAKKLAFKMGTRYSKRG